MGHNNVGDGEERRLGRGRGSASPKEEGGESAAGLTDRGPRAGSAAMPWACVGC